MQWLRLLFVCTHSSLARPRMGTLCAVRTRLHRDKLFKGLHGSRVWPRLLWDKLRTGLYGAVLRMQHRSDCTTSSPARHTRCRLQSLPLPLSCAGTTIGVADQCAYVRVQRSVAGGLLPHFKRWRRLHSYHQDRHVLCRVRKLVYSPNQLRRTLTVLWL